MNICLHAPYLHFVRVKIERIRSLDNVLEAVVEWSFERVQTPFLEYNTPVHLCKVTENEIEGY